jgi:hypothetical protein
MTGKGLSRSSDRLHKPMNIIRSECPEILAVPVTGFEDALRNLPGKFSKGETRVDWCYG